MGGFLALGCGAPDAHQNRNPAQMKKLCGVATGGWWFRSMRSCVRLTATGKTQRMRPQRPLSSKPSNAWKRGFKTPDPIASVRNGWRVAEGRKRDGVQSFFRTGYPRTGPARPRASASPPVSSKGENSAPSKPLRVARQLGRSRIVKRPDAPARAVSRRSRYAPKSVRRRRGRACRETRARLVSLPSS